MKVPQPAMLWRQYENGEITRHELLTGVIHAAVVFPPARIVSELPADLLAELREEALQLPASPYSIRLYYIGMRNDDSQEQARREWSVMWCEGLWRWYRYFRHGE
jgi:hypothetical protein